jgi:hypothetical protein
MLKKKNAGFTCPDCGKYFRSHGGFEYHTENKVCQKSPSSSVTSGPPSKKWKEYQLKLQQQKQPEKVVEEYDWKSDGHKFINKRVARSFFDESKAIRFAHGTITKWLPPDDEDEALFHMVHEDGDEEDLNEAEALDAIGLYKQTTLHIGDPVIVNWRGKGKWWHGRIADVHKKSSKKDNTNSGGELSGATPFVNVYDIRYDDGDTEKNVPQKNIYKRFVGDTSKSVPIVPDEKGGTGIHLIPVSGIRRLKYLFSSLIWGGC